MYNFMKSAIALISGGIDSPVAAKMMKDKMGLIGLHFSIYPLSDNEPEEKARAACKKLGIRFITINVAKEFKDISEQCNRKFYFVLSKRLMMRIAEALAKKLKADYIITGENLGQVSSQTGQNLHIIDKAVNIPILRQLIGLDKNEIIHLSKKYKLFEISNCKEACAILGGDKPSTRARLAQILEEEEKIETDVKNIVNSTGEF